jgi:hypothetical protein
VDKATPRNLEYQEAIRNTCYVGRSIAFSGTQVDRYPLKNSNEYSERSNPFKAPANKGQIISTEVNQDATSSIIC